MNTQITITQENLRALHNSISACGEYLRANYTGSHSDIYLRNELALAHKTCAYMGHELHKAWSELPDGTPLKEIYRDDIWHPEPDPIHNYDPEDGSAPGTESTDLSGSGEGHGNSNKRKVRGARRQDPSNHNADS